LKNTAMVVEFEELKAQAEQNQKYSDAANFRDDQFDLSDAQIVHAISLSAVTSLTHRRRAGYI
jgi:hypothetical protein